MIKTTFKSLITPLTGWIDVLTPSAIESGYYNIDVVLHRRREAPEGWEWNNDILQSKNSSSFFCHKFDRIYYRNDCNELAGAPIEVLDAFLQEIKKDDKYVVTMIRPLNGNSAFHVSLPPYPEAGTYDVEITFTPLPKRGLL